MHISWLIPRAPTWSTNCVLAYFMREMNGLLDATNASTTRYCEIHKIMSISARVHACSPNHTPSQARLCDTHPCALHTQILTCQFRAHFRKRRDSARRAARRSCHHLSCTPFSFPCSYLFRARRFCFYPRSSARPFEGQADGSSLAPTRGLN